MEMTYELMAKNEWIDISEDCDKSHCRYSFDNCDSLSYIMPSFGWGDMDYTRMIFNVIIMKNMKEYEYDIEVDMTNFNNTEEDKLIKRIMKKYKQIKSHC